MRRVTQTFDEIFNSLAVVEASWMDSHAEEVILLLKTIPSRGPVTLSEVAALLDSDFPTAISAMRLFLDCSKDEFQMSMKAILGPGGIGVKRYQTNRAAFLDALESLALTEKINATLNRELHWSDVLVERLKGGRGSAIKGQQRGRSLEDFVEILIQSVFGDDDYESRCRFLGASKLSTEKADFAIPGSQDPHILIEVKAYGATGSKQTDVLGDISRIVEQKRDDTVFFLFTDGISWRERPNDLRKLIDLQNRGSIQKIYTKAMADELKEDLTSLKSSFGL